MGQDSIDINALVDAQQPETLAQLDEAARSQRRALWVTEHSSRHGAPDESDAALQTACEGLTALLPIRLLLPPTGIPGALRRVSEIAEEGRCCVARLCPVSQRYPLLDWVLSPIPELCDRHNVSLLLDFNDEQPAWRDLVTFARRFPGVPMVLLAADLERERAAPAALDATANLLLQVTDLSGDGERLVQTFGPSRFVWGSSNSKPFSPADPSPGFRGLSGDERHAVVCGNAEALADGTYAATFL